MYRNSNKRNGIQLSLLNQSNSSLDSSSGATIMKLTGINTNTESEVSRCAHGLGALAEELPFGVIYHLVLHLNQVNAVNLGSLTKLILLIGLRLICKRIVIGLQIDKLTNQ